MTEATAEPPVATLTAPARRPPWTLQKRLIITTTAIVSLILVIVGIATSAILGRVLETSLENEVAAMNGRTSPAVNEVIRADPEITALDILRQLPGAQPGFLLAFATATTTSGAYVDPQGDVVALDDTQIALLDAEVRRSNLTSVGLTDAGQFQIEVRGTGNANIVVGLSRSDISQTITQMLTIVALLTAGGLLVLAAASVWTIRAGLRPLHSIAETAARVAQQPLSEGAVEIVERVPESEADPRTEPGLVGAALNLLLDHVDDSLHARQRNEERMRRFVADASHELRTPLASIRGYSELSLRALAQMPAEQAADTTTQSLERIQAQSVRMTSLVEDLLLLARLDEGTELVRGRVDLSQLVIEAVGDAQAAGGDHEWIVEVDEEPVVVMGDNARLTQVVANLLANARVHTPAGTRVTTSVAREIDDRGDEAPADAGVIASARAIIRVHDDGPGIPLDSQVDLFERFARPDASRARGTGGSGLGLSIARAIVEGHGGEIQVSSTPGSTTFEVRLPAPS